MARAKTRLVRVRRELIADLVLANRILFNRKIVDGYGHISVRHDTDSDFYLMSKMCAPGLVTTGDIDTYDLDSNSLRELGRPYSERFIHGEIYKVRSDVNSIIHCHTPELIPFGITKTPLRPVYQMSSFLGGGVPVFEIRKFAGMSDLMVRDGKLGKALARTLSDRPLVLMRGHGATFVGESIRVAVYRAVYAAENAWLQMEAMRLGKVTYLAPKEAELGLEVNNTAVERPWAIWTHELAQRRGRASTPGDVT